MQIIKKQKKKKRKNTSGYNLTFVRNEEKIKEKMRQSTQRNSHMRNRIFSKLLLHHRISRSNTHKEKEKKMIDQIAN